MKDFAKALLAILILFYCQQTIGEINCKIVETVDTSTISVLRRSYEKKYTLLNVDGSIEKWKQTAKIIFFVSLVLTFCGTIITVLQAGNGNAIKILVAVLGMCVVLLNEFRKNMPDGTYKTYHTAIEDAKKIKVDLDSDFADTKSESLTPIMFKTAIASICENIKTLETLQKNYPTDIPFALNFVGSADAAPTWWSDASITGIRASGTGASRIEAKSAAEKQGLIEIQKQIESKIDSQLKEPIFSPLKQAIKDASMLAVQKESESFEDTDPVSYWILYQIDNSFIDSILKGISFPLVIFKTDFIEPKIEAFTPTASAHGEKSQAALMRMRTIHWFDLNWSKEELKVNDTMTISGKSHVFAGWPETVDKPESSFLNIGIPAPVFIRAGSWIGGQLVPRSVTLELGETYEFKVLLKARRPGDWRVPKMINVRGGGPIIGTGKGVTISGSINKDLSDYGFNVTEQPAPRGPNSETNAIFVGSGVPIDAIKKTVELLVNADIPIKAIIYPWAFQNSKLAEKQKFNLVQIGGTKMLESSPNFSKESLEKLKTITSQDEMVSFCKESTEALKKSWGLK